jgi:hypothetical protein
MDGPSVPPLCPLCRPDTFDDDDSKKPVENESAEEEDGATTNK